MARRRTLTLVLGGGRGTRLYPLTAFRAKPAVPLGGKYRLIDIPLSNAINSGLREIWVLTQFNSKSLNNHVARSYWFDPFTQGFVDVLAAQQTDASGEWFQGTADAVRQNLHYLERHGEEVDILILSGDHLYRMDYRPLVARHRETGADVTVCTIPRDREGCLGFGVMAADREGLLTGFVEKPAPEDDISHLETPAALREAWSMGDRPYLASMGVYLFRLSALKELLAEPGADDFGRHVIPAALGSHRVAAYLFDGYWEDIGTIEAFYQANLMLCRPDPPFRFHTAEAPVYTHPRFLPGSRFRDAHVECSLVAEGCLVYGARVEGSVVGLRSRLAKGAVVRDSVVMGADWYEDDTERVALLERGEIPMGIGKGASIRRAIVDKNARIGDGAVIHGDPGRPDEDHPGWSVRDGIVVVKKNAVIPPGTVV